MSFVIEYRLSKKSGVNPLVSREQRKWRDHSQYAAYDDMVKAIKDLNKNHKGLFQSRQKMKGSEYAIKNIVV